MHTITYLVYFLTLSTADNKTVIGFIVVEEAFVEIVRESRTKKNSVGDFDEDANA